MNAHPGLSVSPLSWVKGEIDYSLGLARENLTRASHRIGGPQALAGCEAHLKQVRGALTLLGLDGATRYCETLEQTIKAFADGRLRIDKAALSIVDRSIFALLQFLDDLAKGDLNVPIKLFPVYRELVQLQDAREVAEKDLFFPDLKPAPPAHPSPRRLNEAELVKYVNAHRTLFQRGLLAWLKMPGNRQGINNMRFATEALEQVAAQLPGKRAFWWVATAFIEALAKPKPEWLANARPLCSRIDRHMRDLAQGRDGDPEALLRELLYALALADPVSKRVREVKQLYQLDQQLPEYGLSGSLEYDMSKLQPVLDDMRERLTGLEDSWARYTSGNKGEIAQFREQSTRLKAMAKDLGAYRVVKLLDVIVLIACKLPDPYPPQNETLMLEMGAAFLLMETMLDSFINPPTDIEQQVTVMVGWLLDAVKPRSKDKQATPGLRDDVTQRTHIKLIHSQVAKEITGNLQQVEQVIDAVSRQRAEPENLASLPAYLKQVRGALDMLRLHRPNEVLAACDELIARCARPDHGELGPDLEWLAEGLSCLGFYMDELARGQFAGDEVLDFFLERYARRQTVTPLPAAERVAAPPASLAVPALPSAGETAPHLPHIAQPALPAGVPLSTPAALRRDLDSVDAEELLTVFLEEARQVVATIETQRAICAEAPDDMEALTVIRRGFHTLKGSGRMVGLTELGEFAWEIEQTLNQWLRENKAATAALLQLITQANELFAASVSQLKTQTPLDLQRRNEIVDLAQRLREGWAEAEPASEPAAPVAQPPAPEEITIGAIRLPAALFDIYVREAREHLAALASAFAGWRDLPEAPIPHAFVRAAHTLASSSRTTGFLVIAELAATLEQWLQYAGASAARLPPGAVDAVGDAVRALQRMFDDVIARKVPQSADLELTRLQALLATSLAREPAPPSAIVASAPVARAPVARAPVTAQPSAPRTAFADDLDAQLLPTFLDEASSLLPQISADLRAWKADRNDDQLPRALARALHTLKGSARMAGAIRIGEAAHAMESRIGLAIEAGMPEPRLFEEMEAELDSLSDGLDRIYAQHADRAASAERAPMPASPLERHLRSLTPMLRVEADIIDQLVNEAGEVAIQRTRVEGEMDVFKRSLHDLTDSVARLRQQVRETQIQADSQLHSRSSQLTRDDGKFDPLEFDRYTRLQELARMMAESLHDISTVQQSLLANLGETQAALGQQARVSRDLQNQLLQLRTVPFAILAERLHRTVRQTAKELGKPATLDIRGTDIEIDRSVLQRIGAPIEHMLRNSIAHGIETSEVRQAAGKPAAGQIVITVRQEGNEIEMQLADDGAGLNLDLIRLEAMRNGLLQPGEEIDDAGLMHIIFSPGFSTAREVTETSGRGVGMDVVRSEIAGIGGRVDVTSTPGAGTTFSVFLPQSLAVSQALLVRAGSQTYAIPATLVEQVQELKPEALSRLYTSNTVEWDNHSYRFFYLPRLMGQHDAVAQLQRHNSILLLKSGVQRIAVHVDQVLKNQEIVLKNIGPQLARVAGMAGATVLGSGLVVLIVNPVQVAMRTNVPGGLAGVMATPVAIEETPALLVMVVDDSLTVRSVTSRLLKREGYQVATAKDGVDALQQIQESLPELMLVDIEMPRMDGFELTQHLRADPRTADIPIIIITSRTAEKHRQRALELGADAFFGKPYLESELLQAVEQLAGRRYSAELRASG